MLGIVLLLACRADGGGGRGPAGDSQQGSTDSAGDSADTGVKGPSRVFAGWRGPSLGQAEFHEPVLADLAGDVVCGPVIQLVHPGFGLGDCTHRGQK